MKGDTINRARVVRDYPYWAVIDQQHVLARFPTRRVALNYSARVNARPDMNYCLQSAEATR